jgi:hypothetical protein
LPGGECQTPAFEKGKKEEALSGLSKPAAPDNPSAAQRARALLQRILLPRRHRFLNNIDSLVSQY